MFTNLFLKAKADKNELISHHKLGDTKKKHFLVIFTLNDYVLNVGMWKKMG